MKLKAKDNSEEYCVENETSNCMPLPKSISFSFLGQRFSVVNSLSFAGPCCLSFLLLLMFFYIFLKM